MTTFKLPVMSGARLPVQKSRLRSVVNMAGPRYDTRVNLILPISFTFDVLCRTDEFNKKLLALATKVWEESRFIGRKSAYDISPSEYDELAVKLKSITEHLKKIRRSDVNKNVRWNLLAQKSETAEALINKISQELYPLEENDKQTSNHDPNRDIKAEINELYRLGSKLRELKNFISSPAILALSKNAILVYGDAGSGKTHLLCDVATKRINAGLPTYIFLGEEFNSGDPLRRMAQLINGGSAGLSIFRKIDELARKQNVKALIIIDAINEATGRVTWSQLSKIKKYKNIAVAISIRSGFEKSELNNSYGRKLTKIEHEGFGELDWQAVSNFFHLFGIALPKVPIIAPEFRNPLFLKLFCETYKRSRVFRGHLGTTKLFEAYNKKQGLAILADLSLPADNTRIWKRITKPAAQWMADNSQDRILESKILAIVEAEFPGRSKEVLKLMQRHWLLTKVPHYTKSGKARGHEYRFPYQKFSDHLITRCLLTTHLRDKNNPELYFESNMPLGKVAASWNYGLIEALSIQVPERLDGTDLVWVVPKDLRAHDPIQKGFLQSIVWRDLAMSNGHHKYFDTKSTLDYVNKYVIGDEGLFSEFLSAALSIAGLPDHPLNANTLHKYLRQFTMANRDIFWQEFLTYNYEDHSILKRLIDWAWHKESKQYLPDESLELVAIPLLWFLASSNRVIRDRSTKALVELLKCREDVLVKLLDRFDDVNDPYIKQRLYAVAYGCALRCETTQNLKKVAEAVYGHIFDKGVPPADVLLRDYARNTVEVYYARKPGLPFVPSKFRPPYNSEWPKRVPSLKTLQKKYREDDDVRKDHYSIWSSVIYGEGAGGIGDFGNYVVNNNLFRFIGTQNGVKRPKTERELLKEFEGKLTPLESELLQKARDSRVFTIRIINYLRSPEKVISEPDKAAELAAKKAMDEFVSKVLSKPKYEAYKIIVLESLSEGRLKGYEKFNAGRGQRWIVSRVMQLGWRPEKHGQYDKTTSQFGPVSRDRNRNERIGKKYQWIALHELLARATDNFLLGEDYDDNEPKPYEGPWQLSIRDIDPTHTIEKTAERKPTEQCWWTPVNYSDWNQVPKINDWLKSPDDLPDFTKLMQITDDKGVTWLNLKGYYTWEEPLEDVEESRRYDVKHKQVWTHIYGYVVDKKSRMDFYNWATKQDFWNKWMPESGEFYSLYYGEFPNSAAFTSIDSPYYRRQDWEQPEPRDGQRSPVKLMVANDEYAQEGNTSDCSIESGFSIQTPCKYLYQAMNLTTGHDNGEYTSISTGEIVFKDPSVQGQGPGVLLANKKLLIDFLDKKNLTVVWTVIGEKMLIGGNRDNFQGRLRINGAYTLPGTKPKGSYSVIVE